MARIALLSDVHFGAHDPAVVEGVVADVHAFGPDVVVVSGDLTQRAKSEQFAQARAFLDRLGVIGEDLVVVPGNHDIPLYDLLRRATRPRERFRRFITTERAPFVRVDGVAVLGLDTSRPEVWKNGELSSADVREIRERLATVPADVLKVVVTHHPFVPPPGHPEARIVVGARRALAAASECGVDLLLSGHRHAAHRADVRTAHPETARGMLLVMAGTATSHRRRDEPNSWTAIDGGAGGLTVTDRVWDGGGFAPQRSAAYAREGHVWSETRA